MYGSWDMVRDGRTDGQTDGQKKWHIEVAVPPKNNYIWIIVIKMDKTYNGSSVIYGKKAFNFAIYYLVILYYGLDLILN